MKNVTFYLDKSLKFSNWYSKIHLENVENARKSNLSYFCTSKHKYIFKS